MVMSVVPYRYKSSGPSLAWGSNLVDNGGMEGVYDDESAGGGGTVNVAPNWNKYDVATDGTDTLDESATAHGGAKSQSINVNATTQGIAQPSSFGADTKWYLVTAWFYGVSGSARIVGSGVNVVDLTVAPPVGVWTQYKVIGQGVGVAKDLLIVSAGGAAEFLVDDVSVQELGG